MNDLQSALQEMEQVDPNTVLSALTEAVENLHTEILKIQNVIVAQEQQIEQLAKIVFHLATKDPAVIAKFNAAADAESSSNDQAE